MNCLDLSSANARVLGIILRSQAESISDATYLMSGAQHYSFGRVNELANAHAAGLRGLGVQPARAPSP
jgi:non-ribosomal peptide synthetase component E (peptide arylation enzyme)